MIGATLPIYHKRFSIVGKIACCAASLDSTQTHLEYYKVFVFLPTTTDFPVPIETLAILIPSNQHPMWTQVCEAKKTGLPLLFKDLTMASNYFVADSYTTLSCLSLGAPSSGLTGAQTILDPSKDINIILRDCLDDYNETPLDLKTLFNSQPSVTQNDFPALPSTIQLDVSSVYSINEGSLTIVQVRDKKGNKLVHFLDEERNEAGEDVQMTGDEGRRTGSEVYPLERLSHHVLDFTVPSLRFYSLPEPVQETDQEKIFFCHEKGKLVAEEEAYKKYYLKLLVLHNETQEHFNLCLTHSYVCEVLRQLSSGPEPESLTLGTQQKLVNFSLPSLCCHVVKLPSDEEGGGLAILETIDAV